VFLFVACMLVASRRIELTILSQHGLTSHLHYAKYIQVLACLPCALSWVHCGLCR
jgi:hypothetical protein